MTGINNVVQFARYIINKQKLIAFLCSKKNQKQCKKSINQRNKKYGVPNNKARKIFGRDF